MGEPKVLYISLDLGSPVHPRGIFSYSMSLIDILKKFRCKITLLVEKKPNAEIELRTKNGKSIEDALVFSQLADLYGNFNRKIYGYSRKQEIIRFIIYKIILVERYAVWANYFFGKKHSNVVVENRTDLIDFIPKKNQFLLKINSFLLKERFYSRSTSRADLGLDPLEVDASAFDLVVIDSPHCVAVTGIEPHRILAIIHDLIPGRDITNSGFERRLFANRLKAILALDANLVFVSNYTRDVFHRCFPKYRARTETIVYPPIRGSTMAAAESDRSHSDYNQRRYRKNDRQRDHDPNKSYFVAVVSDEPRKNIDILVEAFRTLASRADMIIIGNVNPQKYVTDADQNIYFTGFIPESDKNDLIRQSVGMVLPSFSEGFGIPLVEGAVLGVPVLCSDIPVFREIAGDLAYFFDPYQGDTLVSAVKQVLDDRDSGKKTANALRDHVVARFSRKAMAERLAEAFSGVLGPLDRDDQSEARNASIRDQ